LKLRKEIFMTISFLMLLFFFSVSYGQILTGSIKGTVTDTEGIPLPGVTVEVQSPVLIGGVKSFVTSASGLYRIGNLPPGTYAITFSIQGFKTLKREGIIVSVDKTVMEDVVLETATLEETVTVLAETPVVDVTKSGVSTNWETEMMDNLPLLRLCFFDLVNSTPGIWSMAGNTNSTRSVAYGSGSENNVYLFDGVDTTAAEYGAGWAWLNPDVIQEIQVIGVGGKAEYGNFMGATVNIVTKSGGNDFHGGAAVLYQANSLTGNNSKEFLGQLLDNGYIAEDEQYPFNRDQFHDLSFQLGGPIIKDRVWFFTSFWKQYDAYTPPGSDPQYCTGFDDIQVFGKITAQLTRNIKIFGFINYEWFDLQDSFTPEYASLDTVGTERGVLPTGSLALTAILSNTTFFDLKYNYSGGDDNYESVTYFRGPTYYNANTGVASGGPWWLNYYRPAQHGVNATLSHFAEDFLGGDHDFKFGIQYAHGSATTKGGYTAGAWYLDYTYYYDGKAYLYQYKYAMAPYSYGAANNRISGFLDDSWSVSDRLTLNIGIRYDHNTGWIPDQADIAVDPDNNYEWYETGEISPGISDLVKYRVFSPRFGLAYRLTADGKTLLRANIGRYYNHMIYGNWELPPPSAPTWYMYGWNGSDWDLITSYTPELISVDPNLKNPYSDQFSVGIDRELFTNFGLSFTYLEKWSKDLIGFSPVTGDWDDYYELTTVTDPYSGDSLQAYNLIDEYPELHITNPDRFYSRYRMFSLVLNKRMSNKWQLQASFTYSKIWGLNPRGVNRQHNSENILYNSSAARDPNSFLNLEGRMPGDRPFSMKLLGTYLFPYGIAASVNFQIQSGIPYARVAAIYGLNQGSDSVPVEARGDNGHRLPTGYLLDASVEKTFRIANRFSIQARFEVFNLLNKATATRMMDYSLSSGQEWTYSRIWDPRRVQLGLRVRF